MAPSRAPALGFQSSILYLLSSSSMGQELVSIASGGATGYTLGAVAEPLSAVGDNQNLIPESPGSRTSAPSFVSVPDHELLRLIGRGSYGEVWLARNTLGTFRAVKVVHENSFRHKQPFEREFNGVRKFEPLSRSHDGLMDVLQVGRND